MSSRLMNLSLPGEKDLESWEGTRFQSYYDANGKPTIGTGHLILPTEMPLYSPYAPGNPANPRLSQAMVDTLFERDVRKFVNEMNATIKECSTRPNQNQFDALVAFIFNIGIGNWHGSTARRDMIAGKLPLLPTEMMRWIHGDHGVIQGLVNRRQKEIDLFKRPVQC
jgi:lysozyme